MSIVPAPAALVFAIAVNNSILLIAASERILSIDLYAINGKHILTVTPDASSVNVNCTNLGNAVYRIVMKTARGNIYRNITI